MVSDFRPVDDRPTQRRVSPFADATAESKDVLQSDMRPRRSYVAVDDTISLRKGAYAPYLERTDRLLMITNVADPNQERIREPAKGGVASNRYATDVGREEADGTATTQVDASELAIVPFTSMQSQLPAERYDPSWRAGRADDQGGDGGTSYALSERRESSFRPEHSHGRARYEDAREPSSAMHRQSGPELQMRVALAVLAQRRTVEPLENQRNPQRRPSVYDRH